MLFKSHYFYRELPYKLKLCLQLNAMRNSVRLCSKQQLQVKKKNRLSLMQHLHQN